MTQLHRDFPQLARRLSQFSASTRTRLTRSLVHTLRGRQHTSRAPLDTAVVDACNELRAAGVDDQAIVALLSALVEETGRACGADRPSLMSGQLRWVPVRDRVLALVGTTLRALSAVTTPLSAPLGTPMVVATQPIGAAECCLY